MQPHLYTPEIEPAQCVPTHSQTHRAVAQGVDELHKYASTGGPRFVHFVNAELGEHLKFYAPTDPADFARCLLVHLTLWVVGNDPAFKPFSDAAPAGRLS